MWGWRRAPGAQALAWRRSSPDVQAACGTLLNREDAKNARDTTESEIEGVAAVRFDNPIKDHRVLDPGLLEAADQACLEPESERDGLEIGYEVPLENRHRDV